MTLLRPILAPPEDFFLTEGVGLAKEDRGTRSEMNKTQEEDAETQMISLDLPPLSPHTQGSPFSLSPYPNSQLLRTEGRRAEVDAEVAIFQNTLQSSYFPQLVQQWSPPQIELVDKSQIPDPVQPAGRVELQQALQPTQSGGPPSSPHSSPISSFSPELGYSEKIGSLNLLATMRVQQGDQAVSKHDTLLPADEADVVLLDEAQQLAGGRGVCFYTYPSSESSPLSVLTEASACASGVAGGGGKSGCGSAGGVAGGSIHPLDEAQQVGVTGSWMHPLSNPISPLDSLEDERKRSAQLERQVFLEQLKCRKAQHQIESLQQRHTVEMETLHTAIEPFGAHAARLMCVLLDTRKLVKLQQAENQALQKQLALVQRELSARGRQFQKQQAQHEILHEKLFTIEQQAGLLEADLCSYEEERELEHLARARAEKNSWMEMGEQAAEVLHWRAQCDFQKDKILSLQAQLSRAEERHAANGSERPEEGAWRPWRTKESRGVRTHPRQQEGGQEGNKWCGMGHDAGGQSECEGGAGQADVPEEEPEDLRMSMVWTCVPEYADPPSPHSVTPPPSPPVTPPTSTQRGMHGLNDMEGSQRAPLRPVTPPPAPANAGGNLFQKASLRPVTPPPVPANAGCHSLVHAANSSNNSAGGMGGMASTDVIVLRAEIQKDAPRYTRGDTQGRSDLYRKTAEEVLSRALRADVQQQEAATDDMSGRIESSSRRTHSPPLPHALLHPPASPLQMQQDKPGVLLVSAALDGGGGWAATLTPPSFRITSVSAGLAAAQETSALEEKVVKGVRSNMRQVLLILPHSLTQNIQASGM